MGDPFDEYTPPERRGFARLLADEMRQHLQDSMKEAVREYMGQNGQQHRDDHAEIAEERKRRIEEKEKFIKDAEEAAKETKRFRRGVMSGILVAIVVSLLNVIGRLLGY